MLSSLPLNKPDAVSYIMDNGNVSWCFTFSAFHKYTELFFWNLCTDLTHYDKATFDSYHTKAIYESIFLSK